MEILTPARPPSEQPRTPEVPEMLFPEARRRRRRRRWIIGVAVAVLCASGAGVSLTVAGIGSGGSVGHGTSSGSSGRPPSTVAVAPVTGAELAGGMWSTLIPPHPESENTWYLAAWTGRYVIAWGTAQPCCEMSPGKPTGGSSEHGSAFDPATSSWRSIPPAPLNFTVESTIWTGHQVFVWGSTAAATQRAARNVLLGFNPTTWQWRRLATAPIASRSGAQVVWTGSSLIVFGGSGTSQETTLLDGSSYNPVTNQWTPLPALPRFAVSPGSTQVPVGVTAAWAAGSLYVWVTHQISRVTSQYGEIRAGIQAVRWKPGSARWQSAPAPPNDVPLFEATAVSMGSDIALLDGSGCLPEMSCPGRVTGQSVLLHLATDSWSSIPTDAVLESATPEDGGSFVWTGRSLVAVSPYLTSDNYLVGGYAAAFNPASGSWVTLPDLPVPTAQPSGPVLSGTVWAGSELIDSGLVLKPGHHSSSTGPSTASAVPTCPLITFPEWVGGTFCGPPPGPGNGSGPDGSCLGTETAPPCGPGMVAGQYYAYTLISSCTNDYIDGRWWTNELPGGSGPLDVWMSVTATGTNAGWIGPNGGVGFRPSAATSCT